MANKDHTLDAKIVVAARNEFLKNGYQQASLHNIVKAAGLTTGALYTRYRGKDDLFCSLCQPLLHEIEVRSKPIFERYLEVQHSNDPNLILAAIHEEMLVFSKVLFDNYEDCILLYCKSAGSTIDKMINEMMDNKINSTINYFKSIAKDDAGLEGVGALLTLQFHFFREILLRGYSREQTMDALKIIYIYQEAGWKAVFDEIF